MALAHVLLPSLRHPGCAPAKAKEMEAAFMFGCGGDFIVNLVSLCDDILIAVVCR